MEHYLLLPFVEFEIRLGTLSKKFDTSLDKNYFTKIRDSLNLSKENFNNIEILSTKEYINNNLKLIINNKNTKLIMKENVLTKTFVLNNSPFDIRFSVNQEFKLDSYIDSFSKETETIRKKERTSYISDNYRYDLTVVDETINNITKEKYEIEIELLVNKETLTWSNDYINDFIECKIYDLINIVEPMEREKFKIKLN
jgi:hypothetical protein